MKSAKAFSPANITCFFAIVQNKNPLKKGSLGVSFAINKGVYAGAWKSKKNEIIVNGVKKRFPTVETALKMLTDEKLKIELKTELPIGCGYGMSGACTLASVFAVNKLLNLKKSRNELGMIAHEAEVINNTGLGSVTAELLGGLLIRSKKGMPLTAKRINPDKKEIYYHSFGPLDTKKVITSKKMKRKINKQGRRILKAIGKKEMIKLDELIVLSKYFAKKTRLLHDKRVINLINKIEKKGGKASMNMLGNSVFANIPFKGGKKALITDKGAKAL
jgi:pantoate kinase